jgi:nucleotide-binding universal stress UspA family protein
MFHTILVPVDGSPFSEQAIPAALDIARLAGATVELVRVHVPLFNASFPTEAAVPIYDPAWEKDSLELSRKWLNQAAARAGAGSGVTVAPVLLEGDVVESLQEHASTVDADLIVMSTHGRGGMSRAWIGSVADGVVRSAERPVMLVRPDRKPVPAGGSGLRTVAILLDGSPFSEQIVEPALEVARLFGGSITLVRVLTPTSLPVSPPAMPLAFPDAGDLERLTTDARRYLDEIANRLTMRGFTTDTVLLEHPSPARALLEWLEQRQPDLVAMATHGRGGVARLMIGSVADKVMRVSGQTVLVMRPSTARIVTPQFARLPDRGLRVLA